MGVIDEHDILEENQVLVGNGSIRGKVLICRSPCYDPGDIQIAEAVSKQDLPFYNSLNNSLVFSAKGNRPLADMLAGGDLDGDEFYVIVRCSRAFCR